MAAEQELENLELKAKQGSVAKWAEIVKSPLAPDRGGENCPLCLLYRGPNAVGSCEGCPVKEASGNAECQGTPYEEWLQHQGEQHEPIMGAYYREPYCRECLHIARAELKFLESL